MDNIASHENWKSCFSEIGPGLLLFARQWTRSAADAEDIVQEAFVKFWRRNHQINNRALLYATVRSIALDFIRRDKRRARREATVFAEADPTIEPQFELEDETQSALAAAVSCLPHDQREVLVLKIWNELTFSEIASALGISQNTAASRYRYALGQPEEKFATPMNDFSELENDLKKRCDQRSLRPCFLSASRKRWPKIPGLLCQTPGQ